MPGPQRTHGGHEPGSLASSDTAAGLVPGSLASAIAMVGLPKLGPPKPPPPVPPFVLNPPSPLNVADLPLKRPPPKPAPWVKSSPARQQSPPVQQTPPANQPPPAKQAAAAQAGAGGAVVTPTWSQTTGVGGVAAQAGAAGAVATPPWSHTTGVGAAISAEAHAGAGGAVATPGSQTTGVGGSVTVEPLTWEIARALPKMSTKKANKYLKTLRSWYDPSDPEQRMVLLGWARGGGGLGFTCGPLVRSGSCLRVQAPSTRVGMGQSGPHAQVDLTTTRPEDIEFDWRSMVASHPEGKNIIGPGVVWFGFLWCGATDPNIRKPSSSAADGPALHEQRGDYVLQRTDGKWFRLHPGSASWGVPVSADHVEPWTMDYKPEPAAQSSLQRPSTARQLHYEGLAMSDITSRREALDWLEGWRPALQRQGLLATRSSPVHAG